MTSYLFHFLKSQPLDTSLFFTWQSKKYRRLFSQQDYLMIDAAPDQKFILGIQTFLEYRSLSSINQKILMTLPWSYILRKYVIPKQKILIPTQSCCLFSKLVYDAAINKKSVAKSNQNFLVEGAIDFSLHITQQQCFKTQKWTLYSYIQTNLIKEKR